MLGIELLEASSQAVSVPATNDHLVAWPGAQHHFLQALVSYEVWQDAEGVHTQASNSCSLWAPELVILVIDAFQDDIVELACISLLKFDLSILVFSEILVDLESEVNHLLADLHTYEHVVVVEYLSEQFGSAHADLDDGYLVVGLLDISQHALEEFDLILE